MKEENDSWPSTKTRIDQLLMDYKRPEEIIGENGLLKHLTKAVVERAVARTSGL
jgi:putative transposase